MSLKKCKVCNKNKQIKEYRTYRRTCKKCEYQQRKEYLIEYSRKHYKRKIHDVIVSNKGRKIENYYIYCSCGIRYQRKNKKIHYKSLTHFKYKGTYEEIIPDEPSNKYEPFKNKLIIYI